MSRTLLLLFALVASFTFVTASSAAACSCVDNDIPGSAELHPVVARVTVERAEHDGGAMDVVYTVTPAHVWKGSFDAPFQVRTPDQEGACGLPHLRAGDDVLLFAGGNPTSGYDTNVCSLTQHVSEEAIAQVTAALGAGEAPELRDDATDGELPVDDLEPDYLGTTIAATVLAVLLGVVLWQIFTRRGELRKGR